MQHNAENVHTVFSFFLSFFKRFYSGLQYIHTLIPHTFIRIHIILSCPYQEAFIPKNSSAWMF